LKRDYDLDYRGIKMPKNAWQEFKLKINLTIDALLKELES